jgi:CTP synthase (UTP-ammonia lyase)
MDGLLVPSGLEASGTEGMIQAANLREKTTFLSSEYAWE